MSQLGSLLLLFFYLISEAPNAFAQLDPTFGNNGVVVMPYDTYLSGDNDQIMAICEASDRKLFTADIAFSVVKFNANGTVDSSFSQDGRVQTQIADFHINVASEIIVQQTGNIIIAGTSYVPLTSPDNKEDFAAARLHADGTPDLSFNGTGEFFMDLQNSERDNCEGALLQNDDKLVLYGSSGDKIAFLRLTANGQLDYSFNGNGKALFEFGTSSCKIAAGALDANGKILACGNISVNGDKQLLLLKLKEDGHLDSSFGTDGTVTIDFTGPSSFAYDLDIQMDGKIVVTGRDLTVGGLVARFNADGSPDGGFGIGGKIEITLPGGNFQPEQAVITQDGSIFLSGHIYLGSFEDIVLLKLKPDGSIDSHYSATGIITPLGQKSDRIHCAILQKDGKLLAGGYSYNGDAYQYALLKYTVFPLSFNGEKAPASIKCYPNPSKGMFIIAANSGGNIVISNSLGQRIFRRDITKGENEMDLRGILSCGTYYLKYTSKTGEVAITTFSFDP